jgi:hypothetical protein
MEVIMDTEKIPLTPAEAIALLPDKDSIHTFRQAGGTLLGADWDRKDLIKALNKYDAEVTGENAQALGHGMAFRDEYGYLFIETKKTVSA